MSLEMKSARAASELPALLAPMHPMQSKRPDNAVDNDVSSTMPERGEYRSWEPGLWRSRSRGHDQIQDPSLHHGPV